MTTPHYKTINEYVENGKEFVLLKRLSTTYEMGYNALCNMAFDSYNYYIRQGVEKQSAKTGALNNVQDYCMKCCPQSEEK